MKEFWDNWANDSLGQEVIEALSEAAVEKLKAPRTVPLVVYIGTDRRIRGTATVVGNEVTGHVEAETASSEVLAELAGHGHIGSVEVSFKFDSSYEPSFKGNYPGAKSISLPKKEK